MGNIVLHLKLVRGMKGTLLANLVWCHVKVAHISPGYNAYLNLDEEMIARAPIVDTWSNLNMNQESLDNVYLHYQCDAFKINNALAYQILSKVFTDTVAYVYVKQKKSTQDSQAVFFNVHMHFLDTGHVARQATNAENMLQTSHYDGERKGCDWDKYVALHKEQHVIMESLTNDGYIGMDNGTKVWHFFQSIKSIELEAAVNDVWAHPEKYGTHFDAIMSYLG